MVYTVKVMVESLTTITETSVWYEKKHSTSAEKCYTRKPFPARDPNPLIEVDKTNSVATAKRKANLCK